MDIGFVEKQNGAGRLVAQQPLDVFFRSDGSRWIVWVADVEQAGVRVGRYHGFYVVRKVGSQRDAMYFGADVFCGAARGLVTGVAHHQASRWRGEGAGDAVEGIAGTREGNHVLLFEAFHFRRGGDELLPLVARLVPVETPYDFAGGFDRFGTGTDRIFVAADADGVRWKVGEHAAGHAGGRPLGQGCFIVKRKRRPRRQQAGNTDQLTA